MKKLTVLNEMWFSSEQKEYLKRYFGGVTYYNDTMDDAMAIERARDSHIIVIDQFLYSPTEVFFEQCPHVELIVVNTTAYEHIDLAMLRSKNIRLANLRDYATRDVAEVGVSMVLSLNNNEQFAQQIVDPKKFATKSYSHAEPVYDIWPGHPVIPAIVRRQLKQQIAGIIGMGSIGQEAASMFRALGMTVLGFNRSKRTIPGVNMVPLRRLVKESDVLFLAMKYTHTPETKHILSADLLDLAKEGALLVSIGHPELIDIPHLIRYHEKFRGIGLDYLVTDEVIRLRSVRKHNIIITPHLGSQSVEAYSNLTETIIEAVVGFAQGKPMHLVDQ